MGWTLALSATLGCGSGAEPPGAASPANPSGGLSGSSSTAGNTGGHNELGGTSSAGAAEPLGASGSGGALGSAGGGADPRDAWVLDNLISIAGHVPEVWGAPTVTQTPLGPALCFDGDDALMLPKNPLEGSAAFTLQVLFRPQAVLEGESALAEPRFVHIETSAADRVTVEARIDSTEFYLDTFIASAGQSKTLIDATRRHSVDAWHWAALSYADGMMHHYVDGVLDASAALTAAPLGAGKTSLGARQNRVHWFKGCIRELRFAPRALPAESLSTN